MLIFKMAIRIAKILNKLIFPMMLLAAVAVAYLAMQYVAMEYLIG